MKNIITASVTALVIGLFLGSVITTNIEGREHVMSNSSSMSGMNHSMGSAMDTMMMNLNGKTGDAFDKAFIEEMVVHHEGAVEMAQAALKYGKHQEILTLANAIIIAQEKEINDMKMWYRTWYGADLK